MNHWKTCFVALLIPLLAACAAPRYTGTAIPIEVQTLDPDISLVRHEATREGFRQAIEDWLSKNQYQYKLTESKTRYDNEDLTITYIGHWKWDLAIYLSEATITAFHKGKPVGAVTYQAANNLNTKKFNNAEERIIVMLDILFGKKSLQEAAKSI